MDKDSELSSRARRAGRNNGADRQVRPTIFLVANGYTSFHRAGFNTFDLRGKTYGKVLVGSDC